MTNESRFAVTVLVLASLKHFAGKPTVAQLLDPAWAFPPFRWCA